MMKKLFLFVSVVALTISLNSCSKSSSGGGALSMKIDGVKKTFKVVAYQFSGATSVHGYIGNINSPTETIDFDLASGTGDKVDGFTYGNNSNFFTPETFTSNVTKNTTTSAKGTFSGTLSNFGTGTNKVITEVIFL